MANYKSSHSGTQLDDVIDLISGKGLNQVTGLVQRNADGTFSQGSSNSGSSDVFIAEYNVTTYAEILAAINADKRIIIKKKEGDEESPDVLYYVNKYEIYNNNIIHLDAIGYNSYVEINILSNDQWNYYNSRFKREDQLIKSIIYYDVDDFYDIASKIQYFDEAIDVISFIKDPSYGFGLILSYSYSSTSSQNKIEFTALLNSMSNTSPYRIKYTVIKNLNTGNVTWSRSSTQLQSKLVSGTDIKTINDTSLLGSGNITVGGEDNVQSDWNQTNTSADDYIKNKPTVPEVFVVTPNVTTYNQLLAAMQAGKYMCIKPGGNDWGELSWVTSIEEDGDEIYLRISLGAGYRDYVVDTNDTWTTSSSSINFLTSNSDVSASQLTGSIPSSVTATTQSSGDNSTKIATTAYVDGAISSLPDPMVFKGSLGTSGTITTLPTAATTNKGFTYKVITDGTYTSQTAKVGDTFISDGSAWILIPSGDEPSGTVTSIATGAGLTGGPITSSGTIKANLVSETSQGTIGTTDKLYAVGIDSTGVLCTSVPWTNTTYESKTAVSSGTDVSLVTTGEKYTWNNKQDGLVSGTNIKTINGSSLLGSGNLQITSGVSDVQIDSTSIVSSGIANILTASTPTTNTIAKFDSFAHINSTDMTSSEIDSFIQSVGLHGRSICPYDVGDIYETINSTNPSTKWDNTTWELMSNKYDYVVEQGTSGIWTYRKWYSGVAECWGTKTFPSATFSSGTTKSIAVDFPSNLFVINKPAVKVSGGITGIIDSTIVYTNSSLGSIDSYIKNLSSSSVTQTYFVSYYAVGQWKNYTTPLTTYKWRRLN